MFKVQQNRYLWVHLVGLATVPLLLDICLAGLASARPAFDYAEAFGLQFWMVALVGIAPSLWMQVQRPFYIYSLPPLAVKPSALSERDRRCLTVLKSWQIKALAGVTAGFLIWLLAQLYAKLPQISPLMEPRVGLVSAIAAFFFVCLFLQISVSVVRSLLIGQDTLQRVKPFEVSEISSSFLIPGLRVSKILPTEPIAADSSLSEQPQKPLEKLDVEEPDIEKLDIEKLDIEKLDIEKLDIEEESLSSEKTPENLTENEGEIDELATETIAASDTDLENQTEEAATPSTEIEASEEPAPTESASDEPVEVAAEVPAEEPPLVIPEIIESDNFESDNFESDNFESDDFGPDNFESNDNC